MSFSVYPAERPFYVSKPSVAETKVIAPIAQVLLVCRAHSELSFRTGASLARARLDRHSKSLRVILCLYVWGCAKRCVQDFLP